jgi:hypothetical protein
LHAPEADIDHPSHENWWQVSDEWLAEHRGELRADLRARFAATGQDFESLWSAVEQGIARTNAYRVTHERLNQTMVAGYVEQRGMLLPVSAAEEVPTEADFPRYDYETLTGHDATLERYIPWVGRAALAAFDCKPAYCDKVSSLSLEIGGVGQAGQWDGTARLDGILEALPARLRRSDAELSVVEFLHDAKRSYQFIPMREMTGQELLLDDLTEEQRELYRQLKLAEWVFEDVPPQFAMIRRRRPLFDVYAPAGEVVRVFKQSVALLVLSELPKGARDIALKASQVYPGFDQLDPAMRARITEVQARANQLAAVICGAVLERAIREREFSTTAVPLSMQGIMKVKRQASLESA